MNKTLVTKLEPTILVIFLIFYFFLLIGNHPLLVPDEGRYPEIARELLINQQWLLPKLNGVPFLDKPILFYWLEKLAMGAFGVNEWAIRLVPTLFGIVSCLAVYALGVRLFSRQVGLFAALILATSPLYYLASRYANMDLPVAALISLTLIFFILGLSYPLGPKRRYLLWLAYTCSALGFLTKGLIGIALPGLVLGLWILVTNHWRLLKQIYLGTGIVIFLLIVLPWMVTMQIHYPVFFHQFFIAEQVDRYLGQNFNNQQPFWFYLALVLVGVLPWIPLFLTACYEHCRHFITYLKLTRETSHFTALLVIWPLAILIFFSIPASKPPGYILPALPPLALLMAISLARLFNKPSSSTTGQKFLGLGCFLLFSLLAIISFAIIPFIKANFGEAIIYSLKVVGTSTALFSLVIIIQNYCQYRKWLPVTLLISALTFNLTLVLALPYISKSQNSIKPLAEQLKPLLEPGDQVVSYLKYYQDLPLYLNRKQPIIMVINNWQNPQLAQGDNWKSNTYIGSQLIKGNYHWLVNQDTFIKQLTTNQRFYIFTSYAVYQGLEKEIKLYLIAKHHDKVLVSNQPLANKG